MLCKTVYVSILDVSPDFGPLRSLDLCLQMCLYCVEKQMQITTVAMCYFLKIVTFISQFRNRKGNSQTGRKMDEMENGSSVYTYIHYKHPMNTDTGTKLDVASK